MDESSVYKEAQMEQGTRVIVRAYGGKKLERIVWEDVGAGVLLTTEGEFERAKAEGREPIVVGFPREDVLREIS